MFNMYADDFKVYMSEKCKLIKLKKKTTYYESLVKLGSGGPSMLLSSQ